MNTDSPPAPAQHRTVRSIDAPSKRTHSRRSRTERGARGAGASNGPFPGALWKVMGGLRRVGIVRTGRIASGPSHGGETFQRRDKILWWTPLNRLLPRATTPATLVMCFGRAKRWLDEAVRTRPTYGDDPNRSKHPSNLG